MQGKRHTRGGKTEKVSRSVSMLLAKVKEESVNAEHASALLLSRACLVVA